MVFLAGSWASAAPPSGGVITVDPSLPAYQRTSGVSGSLKMAGSDTMVNVATAWAEGFRRFYPSVQPGIEGKGSNTAIPALIEGAVDFGPMSRDVSADEISAFDRKFGYKPTQLKVAVDVLAVYVHKDNPIEGLTLEQLDAIYSTARNDGAKNDIRTWGDLGLKGEWAQRPISLYSRNAASGTYTYFKDHVLKKGDFKDSVKEQPGSSAVVQGVANDRYSIGYSGIGYKSADARAVPLADKTGAFVAPDIENGLSGKYPLSRFLLLSVNYRPGSTLDPLKREFIKYVYSRQGQEDVIKEGFYPVPPKIRAKAMLSVGIDSK